MITKKTINGDTYLRISDLAALSGVNIRTLQRWANDGKLVNFLTIYQTPSGLNYFKLGFPQKTDQLVPGSKFKYQLACVKRASKHQN